MGGVPVVAFDLTQIYGDRSTTLSSIRLSNYSEIGMAPGAGELDLVINFRNPLEASGPSEIVRTIRIRTEKDAAGDLTECAATARMSDGLWRRSPSNLNNIYFAPGYVGIGTLSPSSSLHIVAPGNQTDVPGEGISLGKTAAGDYQLQITQNGGAPLIDFARNLLGDFDARIVSSAPDSLTIVTASAGPVMTVQGQKVGIGTDKPSFLLEMKDDTPGAWSPIINLETSDTTAGAGQTSGIRFSSGGLFKGGIFKNKGDEHVGIFSAADPNNPAIHLHGATGPHANWVGIGIRSPEAKLHMHNGGVLIDQSAPGVALWFRDYDNPANRRSWYQSVGDMGQLYFQAINDAVPGVGGGDMVQFYRKQSAGLENQLDRLIIGNTTDSGGTSMSLTTGRDADGWMNGIVKSRDVGVIYSVASGADQDVGFFLAPWSNKAGGAGLRLDRNGNATITGDLTVTGVFTHPSDRNLKNNIRTLEGSLQKVSRLRGVEYVWNDQSSRQGQADLGLIAQEVEAVFPALVHESNQENQKKTKTLDYRGLLAPLIEGMKELYQMTQETQDRVSRLNETLLTEKEENERLRHRLKVLETRFEQLEKSCAKSGRAP